MRLGYHTITWGGVTGDATGVTSVKDLFYRVPGSMPDALRAIGAAGYQGVEMFDGNVADFGAAPEELRDLLAETGLTLVSVYTGGNFVYDEILPDELHRVRATAELAAAFGAVNLVVGGGARRAAGTPGADYDRLAAALDRITDLAEQRGLTACYHPHLTTIVESPAELEKVMSRSRIGFCPDTAHLAAGGGDPAALIRRYADRVRHVHLKDLRREPFAFLPLGQGEIDFDHVLAAVVEVGYDGWLIVELDSYDGDPVEAARISKAFLDERVQA
ncbi:TIM barrel protein [soil metagenome]